jgi:hypothetical protein
MKIKLFWIEIQLFLLRVTAHPNGAQWLQLLWAALEKIFKC